MTAAASGSKRRSFAAVALTLLLSLTLLPALVVGWQPNAQYYGAGQRVAMSSVRTLTFYSGAKTSYRRTQALPQLTCIGSACARYQPDVVQCQAMGDGQWKCTADLPTSLRLGRVEVSCEGYDYAEDPYILKGSCALEYHLLPSGRGRDDPWQAPRRKGNGEWGEGLVDVLFKLIFWGILGVIVWSFIKSIIRGSDSAADRGTSGGGGGGGWGGRGGWWPGGYGGQPPPPYTPKTEPDATAGSSSSWRPGFWTGLGLGGLAATAAASNRNRRQPFYPPNTGYMHDQGYAPTYGFRSPPRTFGGRGYDHDDHDRGIGSSSGWRESTGFGGTRNR